MTNQDTVTKCEYCETKTGWACRLWYNGTNDYAVYQFWTGPATGEQLDAASAFFKLVEYIVGLGKSLACMPEMTE